MASRRSRLSFKPNLGVRSNRSNPGSAAASPAAKLKPVEANPAAEGPKEVETSSYLNAAKVPAEVDGRPPHSNAAPPGAALPADGPVAGTGDGSGLINAPTKDAKQSEDGGVKVPEPEKPSVIGGSKPSSLIKPPMSSASSLPGVTPIAKPTVRRPAMKFTPVTAKSRPRPPPAASWSSIPDPSPEDMVEDLTAITGKSVETSKKTMPEEKPAQVSHPGSEAPEKQVSVDPAPNDVTDITGEESGKSKTPNARAASFEDSAVPDGPTTPPLSLNIMKSPSRFSDGKASISLPCGLKSPPPGLARVRSRFAKTRPNLTPRARHSSMSGSEQEEDRRPTSYLDDRSLSKASSIPQKAAKVLSEDELDKGTLSDADSETRSQEHMASGKQAGRSSDDEHKGESHKARKRRKTEMLYCPVDRTKLTLGDLIHMNPTSNPMTSSGKDDGLPGSNDDGEIILDDPAAVTPSQPQPPSDDEPGGVDDDSVQVPQVTIGPDGQIVLNENSLVVEAPREDLSNSMETINETETCTNVGYGRRSQIKLWTACETKKFYLALSAIGTDFSLMCTIFPKRSRTELKRKFKKEEKINRALIDQAIRERHHFNQEFFDELINLDVEAQEESLRAERMRLKARAKGGPRKKPVKRVKTKGLLYEESEEDDENDSAHEDNMSGRDSPSAACDSAAGGSDEDMDKCTEKTLKKPAKRTRSGRQPKKTKPFTQETTNVPPRKKRKTLMKSDIPAITKCASPGGSVRPQTPGQFISLSDFTNMPSMDGNPIQAGSLVFVTTNPPGGEQSDSSGMIHVYVVAPDKSNANAGIGKGVSLIGGSSLTQLSEAVTIKQRDAAEEKELQDKSEDENEVPEEPNEIHEESIDISKEQGETAEEEAHNEDMEDADLPVMNLEYDDGSRSSNEDDGPTLIIDPKTGLVHIEDRNVTGNLDMKKGQGVEESLEAEIDDNSTRGVHQSIDSPAPCTHAISTELAHRSPAAMISTPAKIALTENVTKEITDEGMH